MFPAFNKLSRFNVFIFHRYNRPQHGESRTNDRVILRKLYSRILPRPSNLSLHLNIRQGTSFATVIHFLHNSSGPFTFLNPSGIAMRFAAKMILHLRIITNPYTSYFCESSACSYSSYYPKTQVTLLHIFTSKSQYFTPIDFDITPEIYEADETN